jgi:Flp pilus assembly protein TadG
VVLVNRRHVTRGDERSGRPSDEGERGATMVLVALFAVVLLGVTAIVVDIAYAKGERREAQNAADAAALAAAQELDGQTGQITRAVNRAMEYAALNVPGLTTADWAGCTDSKKLSYVPPSQPSAGCISFDSATAPTRIRVRVPESSPAFFGTVFGQDGYDVSSGATAARSQTTTTSGSPAGPCGLCIISPGTLQIAGINTLQVTGGGTWAHNLTANSSDSLPGSAISPLPLVWRSNNGSNWGRNVQPSPATFNSRYTQTGSAIPNPFANVTVTYPASAGITGSDRNISWCNGWSQSGNENRLMPNVMYRQSVNLSCGGTVTLAPGTYYFGGNLQVASGVTLTGTNVTLVFGCNSQSWQTNYPPTKCNGSEGGKLNFSSGSTVNITAPSSSSYPYPKFAILFDETERSGSPMQMSGNITLDGAMYGAQVGFNHGSSSGVTRAWTIVAGGTYDFNSGSIYIDNTRFGGTSTTTTPAGLGTVGAISLVG